MAQPNLICPNYCHETALAPSGTNPYILNQGAVAPYRTFAADPRVVAGTKIPYFAGDGTDIEIGWGTYQDSGGGGGPRIVRDGDVFESTDGNSLIAWPGGAGLNIMSDLPAQWVEKIFGAQQTPGLIVRKGEHDYTQRTLLYDANGHTPLFAWDNPDGVSGAPELVQQWAPLRKSGGTENDRTMLSKLFLDPVIALQLTRAVHVFAGLGGDTDPWLQITRNDLRDYLLHIYVGGVGRRIITADGADRNAANILISDFSLSNPGHIEFALRTSASTTQSLAVLNFGRRIITLGTTGEVETLSKQVSTILSHSSGFAGTPSWTGSGNGQITIRAEDTAPTTQIRIIATANNNGGASEETVEWFLLAA